MGVREYLRKKAEKIGETVENIGEDIGLASEGLPENVFDLTDQPARKKVTKPKHKKRYIIKGGKAYPLATVKRKREKKKKSPYEMDFFGDLPF